MKKSDLKTGMIVTTREGYEYVVLLGTTSVYTGKESCDILLNINPKSYLWNKLDYYNEDLIYDSTLARNEDKAKRNDIIKVELAPHPYAFALLDYEREDRKLLWERNKSIKEMTMEELAEHFGCEVKIVSIK